jgi:hypothetical protein
VLRSNNGGEYTSRDFSDFYKEAGIKRELIVPYNPQHNGVTERKNRSIVEVAKATIHDQDLPMFLWGEASSTAVYVQNKSPHQILGDKTPEEAFTSVKPEVSHLRIFGCPVYIHVPKEKRTKLEPSGKKGSFLWDTIESMDLPRDVAVIRKRPAWLRDTLQDAKGHATPSGTFGESKRSQRFSSYMALMSHIIDSKPSSYEEAAGQHVWKDAMMEEYQSIMKNDVWEIVPRPKGKSVVTSKWIYKIKHATDGSIKYKARFFTRGFSQKEGVDYEETFSPIARYTSIKTIISFALVMGWRLH